MKRVGLVLIMLVLVSMLMVGCAEDTATLERNLYYDMEDIYRYGVDFLDEYVDGMIGQTYDLDKLDKQLIFMEETLDELKAPKHLASEVAEWKVQADGTLEVLKDMRQGKSVNLTDRQVEALDKGRHRIYDGFKEYEWK